MVSYLGRDLGICARNGWKKRLPSKDVGWRVKPEDIELYFTQEWWNNAERTTKLGLFLPQDIGHMFAVRGTKGLPVPTALGDGDEQEAGGEYVPEEYEYKPTGQDVVPIEEQTPPEAAAKGSKKRKAKPKHR